MRHSGRRRQMCTRTCAPRHQQCGVGKNTGHLLLRHAFSSAAAPFHEKRSHSVRNSPAPRLNRPNQPLVAISEAVISCSRECKKTHKKSTPAGTGRNRRDSWTGLEQFWRRMTLVPLLQLLERMNASPSWRLGQPTRQVVHIPHESRREAKEERRLTFR